MRFGSVARWMALSALMSAATLAAPAVAQAAVVAKGGALPVCKNTGKASRSKPTTPAGSTAPTACRSTSKVVASGTKPAGTGGTPLKFGRAATGTPSGYTHLGAGTASAWRGVYGRMSVVDGAVRRGTYDFIASRFMMKRDTGGGNISWLEAGWAEPGWAGNGRQLIYTYNTNTKTWQFYDQYQIRPGDQLWFDIHTDGNNVWQAWLWWNNQWNLLTSQQLPVGATGYVEQYVEVYVDPRKAARIQVPRVTVDNVQLRPTSGAIRYWRNDVSTVTGDSSQQRAGGFCINWVTRFDTWNAGNCG